nr:MAG TPA: major tail protein [Caudoviricetes sp.]
MKRFNLQLFAEAVKGKRLVYLYRVYDSGKTKAGAAIAFTTENSRSVSKDADSTATKDGPIRTPGEAEIEISATSVLTKGDTLIDELEEAMLKDSLIEIWETNLDEPVASSENQFKGIYYQGYLTSLEKSSAADGFVEVSLTFGINGEGASGNVTVTTEQQEVAAYVFADTTTRSDG